MRPGEAILCDDPMNYVPPLDPVHFEIARIGECIQALNALPDDDARSRVLSYLVSRFLGRKLYV